jgi:hypothetical protein
MEICSPSPYKVRGAWADVSALHLAWADVPALRLLIHLFTDKSGKDFMLASFHGDTNGLATIPGNCVIS